MNIDGWPSVETTEMGWVGGDASLDRSVANAACTLSDVRMDNEAMTEVPRVLREQQHGEGAGRRWDDYAALCVSPPPLCSHSLSAFFRYMTPERKASKGQPHLTSRRVSSRLAASSFN